MFDTVECKHCHAPLPKEALTMGENIVVCAYCGTVHYMKSEPTTMPGMTKQKRKKPEKFKLNRLADGIEIRYRWLGKQHMGLTFFAVIWNAFIIFFTSVMFMADGADFEPMMIVFLLPFYAVGIGMTYYVVTGFLNTTSIQIRGGQIQTQHSPIPMLGIRNETVDRRAIEQVYCQRRVAYESNDVPVYVFDVHYIKKGGEDVKLLKGLDSIHKAVFIEQQIEHLYRIPDQPVDTEYRSIF
ncbi:MAG: hypothetical protein ACFE0Q_04050 [Anaerolineae bacterium]